MDSFSNAYETTLNGSIDSSQTSLVVTTATGKPPSTPFRMHIKAEGGNTDEIVTVTGTSGTTFTIIRASESYNGVQTASAHSSGATIEHVLTAGVMTSLSGLAGIKTSYLGRTTVGGSYLNMAGGYAKKITVSTAGIIASIDAYVKGNSNNAASLMVFVLSDNAGTPYRVIGSNVFLDVATPAPTFTEYLDTNARWIAKPINTYVDPGTYWIVVTGGNNNGGTQLAYDSTGGSDYNHGGQYASDHATQSYSSSAHDYSIRALFIEATATTTLTHTEFHATSDTAIPNTSTWTDVTGASVSLPIGKYSGFGAIECWATSGAAYMEYRVVDSGESIVYGYGYDLVGPDNENNVGRVHTPVVCEPFTLAATTTLKLQAKTGGGAGGATVKATSDELTKIAFIALPEYTPTPVGAGSRILLDYTKTSDDAGTSLSAATWTDIIPNQTFNVVSALSTVEFSVRSFIQVRDTGAGETFDQGRLVIDSGGTPIYEYFGGELFNDNAYHDIHFKGNVYKTGLTTGSHTIKAQIIANGGGDFYNRPTGSSPFEFFRIQVIEHSNAGDILGSGGFSIRGTVDGPTGDIIRGSGFTCVRTGTGTWTVTFNSPFRSIPVVIGSYAEVATTISVWDCSNISTTGFDCEIIQPGTARYDKDWSFIAMEVA